MREIQSTPFFFSDHLYYHALGAIGHSARQKSCSYLSAPTLKHPLTLPGRLGVCIYPLISVWKNWGDNSCREHARRLIGLGRCGGGEGNTSTLLMLMCICMYTLLCATTFPVLVEFWTCYTDLHVGITPLQILSGALSLSPSLSPFLPFSVGVLLHLHLHIHIYMHAMQCALESWVAYTCRVSVVFQVIPYPPPPSG